MVKSFTHGLGILCLALFQNGYAYDLPPVNLGGTSYLDAAPGPSGLYWIQYVQHYHSDKFKDGNGNTIAFPSPEVDVTVSLTQLLYGSDYELLGGKLGFQAIIPIVGPQVSYGVDDPAFPQAGDTGFGDLVMGPFISFNPVMGANGIKFSHRVELTVFVPTGEYDSNREINPGSNFWSFDPFWSGTCFFTPDLQPRYVSITCGTARMMIPIAISKCWARAMSARTRPST